ncbi:HU family DNA-binding protein [Carboxylicivirga marina]|uniref:HU family DNA-binding protein n=1 Tax=Carboxylicivirga marina TaxID=2800988 RepID=A0ABS1HGC5_9BACT|nr:HU family DNA-binding protein [Carboxylicivirga marina]MBK3516646.1 HU family DNA-binding protein [Carboxylicivirga marina]
MENYILSLIKENNRVIVPNFGAFIVAKENGFSVLFNNFLSFNDGLLVDHIVSEESITREEAEKKIEEYVEKVKQHLDDEGSYDIKGLGSFSKDATGILRFEQSDDLSEESVNTTPPVENTKQDDLLDIDNTNVVDESEKEIEELPVSARTVNETTPIAEFDDIEEPLKDEPKPEFVEETKPEEKNDPVSVANKYLEEDNSKRNRSIAIFLSIFIIPIGLLIVYLFFIKDNSPSEAENKINTEITKTEAKPVDLKPAEGTIDAGPDTTKKQVEEPKVIEEPPVVVEPAINKPHQLIVGSFSTEVNASKMVETLNGKGFDKCFWFLHNDRYLVSLESFAKVYEAQAKQEQILNNERMESWIITKRK